MFNKKTRIISEQFYVHYYTYAKTFISSVKFLFSEFDKNASLLNNLVPVLSSYEQHVILDSLCCRLVRSLKCKNGKNSASMVRLNLLKIFDPDIQEKQANNSIIKQIVTNIGGVVEKSIYIKN